MGEKQDLESLSNDISLFMSKKNIGKSDTDIFNKDLVNLKKVYNRIPTIKKLINNLSCSKVLQDVIEQDSFFSHHYYDFLEGKTIGNIPPSIQNIQQFYSSNKDDSYFQFKKIYEYVFSKESKILKETYNLYYKNGIKSYFSEGEYYQFCSVCQQQICIGTRDLDHYLSKKYFPILSLRYFNLVPMCSICNRQFKKMNLAEVPNIHPYKVSFPLKNIPISLKKLSEIEINYDSLDTQYKNYIKLMNLKSRLKHEDIETVIVALLKRIETKTEEKIKRETNRNLKIKDIQKLVLDSIQECSKFYSEQQESFNLIRIKVLVFLKEDQLSSLQIASILFQKNLSNLK